MDLENNLGKLPQLVGVERICYFLLLRALQLNRRSNGGTEDAGQVYAATAPSKRPRPEDEGPIGPAAKRRSKMVFS